MGIVAGMFALGLVAAPFVDPDGQRVVAGTPASTEVAGPAEELAAAITTTTTLAQLPPLPGGDDTVVSRVVDGDTLVVEGGTRVRLIGMDAPEVQDCFSSEATGRLVELAGPGTGVRLVYDAERLDRYGRTLAYVYRRSDGLFVNLALTRDGYAQQLTVPPNVRHAEELGLAAADARDADRGLWASCRSTTTGVPVTAPRPQPPPTVAVRTTEPPIVEVPPTAPPVAAGCHSSYAGACVPIAADVDCGGGPGNGPAYVYEKDVQVVGPDVYGLDADHDGLGCES